VAQLTTLADAIADEVREALAALTRVYPYELRLDVVETKYSEDQPRDDHGRWEGGGGESGISATEQSMRDRAASEQAQREWEKTLTPGEKEAVRSWKFDDWETVRANDKTGASSQLHDDFLSAVAKAPSTDAPLYRGLTNLSAGQVQSMKDSGTITLDAVSSTSPYQDVAEQFARTGLEPGGRLQGVVMAFDKQSAGKSIRITSNGPPGEDEAVLPKGTTFRVTGSEQITSHGVADDGHGGITRYGFPLTVLHMEKA
jgi:hypothetical protein